METTLDGFPARHVVIPCLQTKGTEGPVRHRAKHRASSETQSEAQSETKSETHRQSETQSELQVGKNYY